MHSCYYQDHKRQDLYTLAAAAALKFEMRQKKLGYRKQRIVIVVIIVIGRGRGSGSGRSKAAAPPLLPRGHEVSGGGRMVCYCLCRQNDTQKLCVGASCCVLGCIFLFQEYPFLGPCFSFLPGFLRIPQDSFFFRRNFFTGTSFWQG